LRKHTNYIWILDKKEEAGTITPVKDGQSPQRPVPSSRFTMLVNPDSASDIAKIS
jgi:hypothetical protein